MNELILQELQSINKKLEIIVSNFELKGTPAVVLRQPDGTRKVKRV